MDRREVESPGPTPALRVDRPENLRQVRRTSHHGSFPERAFNCDELYWIKSAIRPIERLVRNYRYGDRLAAGSMLYIYTRIAFSFIFIISFTFNFRLISLSSFLF